MPVSTPVSPSSSTTGNMIWVSAAAACRRSSGAGDVAIEAAPRPRARCRAPVIAPSTSITIQNSVVASRNASRLRALLQQLREDRHERRRQRRLREQVRHQVRDLRGDRERRDPRPVPKKYAAMTSRTSPTTRDSAVAAAKIAVLTDRRRRCLSSVTDKGRYSTAPLMANIHSQKKRIERALRERDENRRYTSRSRPTSAGSRPPSPRATTRRRHRAPHARADDRQGRQARLDAPNNGARKKSRAARVRRGARSRVAASGSPARSTAV